MNPRHHDDIDELLRQSFDGPVPDAGFSDRVMRRLPPRRRPSRWPLAAGLFAGAVACSLNLSASPLWRAAWQGWLAGDGSMATVIVLAAMAGMSLLALGWMLAEADDR
jgi:hypothetical protein